MGLILMIVLILLLLGTAPTWPHSRTWGYGPSGTVTVLLVILLVLILPPRTFLGVLAPPWWFLLTRNGESLNFSFWNFSFT